MRPGPARSDVCLDPGRPNESTRHRGRGGGGDGPFNGVGARSGAPRPEALPRHPRARKAARLH
eukprot:2068110-Pyramimonas_sp.AAC.1